MKVLIIKTSSMGDVIHTLPALTDAGKAIPNIQFDWVVEENFAEIPCWHPLVEKVIPVAWRRWRKNIFSKTVRAEWKKFYNSLRKQHYDLIIDAQGLVKSAVLSVFANGLRAGFHWQSAREPIASLFYQKKFDTGPIHEAHAITRTRKLFSAALGYSITSDIPDYGIDRKKFISQQEIFHPYVVFLHGTTWASKHWPENYWIELAVKVNQQGYQIKLPWGNESERSRAQHVAQHCQAEVLPRMKLAEIAQVLAGAKAIVAVDTGLGHLAAALNVPTVSLYGPTNPLLTGALGESQTHLAAEFACSPCLKSVCSYRENSIVSPACFATVTPDRVMKSLFNIHEAS